MTGRGLLDALRFVRAAALVALAPIVAQRHPFVAAAAAAAFVLLAYGEFVRQRRRRSEDRAHGRTRASAWWLGIILPFGLGVWGTFLYLGVRMRRKGWLVWSSVYFAMILIGVWLNALGNDDDPTLSAVATLLWLGAWAGGAVHAYAIREEVRIGIGCGQRPAADSGAHRMARR